MKILSHRGIDRTKGKMPFAESTLEAFQAALDCGFGLEFDIRPSRDGRFIISHDTTLGTFTGGRDNRAINEISIIDLNELIETEGTIIELNTLLGELSNGLHALHFKGEIQNNYSIDLLVKCLGQYSDLHKSIIIFDLLPDTAARIRKTLPDCLLACSVAHDFDVKRYNASTYGTLYHLSDAIRYKHLFDWVWLDEWDLVDSDGGVKKFYSKQLFEKLKEYNYRIAVVSPELHATSSGLRGSECHPDGLTLDRLKPRLKELIQLNPDLICTDYPSLEIFYKTTA